MRPRSSDAKNASPHQTVNRILSDYTFLLLVEEHLIQSLAARTLDEAKNLIENGFEYITDMNNHKLFKKRK